MLSAEAIGDDKSIEIEVGDGNLRRADLDGTVAALAERQGALVEQGTTAMPLLENDRVVGVRLTNAEGERTVLGRQRPQVQALPQEVRRPYPAVTEGIVERTRRPP